jgi:hypothetical protein
MAIIKPGTTATVGSLTPGSTYAFQIRAADEYKNYSAWVGTDALTANGTNVITTLPEGTVSKPPLTGLKIFTWDTSYIWISWTSPSMTPPVASGSWPKPEFTISPDHGANAHTSATTAQFTGLTNNTFYTIGMRLKYEDGTYCAWQYVTQTTGDHTPPQPPSNVWSRHTGNTSLEVHWTNSADTDIAEILVYIRGPTDGTPPTQEWHFVINAAGQVTSPASTTATATPWGSGAAQTFYFPTADLQLLVSGKFYAFELSFTDTNNNHYSDSGHGIAPSGDYPTSHP